MPDRPETWAWLATWLQQNMPALYAGLLALGVAFWRIIYSGGRIRQLVIECPLCGFLGVGVHHGAEFMGFAPSAGTFFAVVVGFLGVETSRSLAAKAISKKVEEL